jgi:DNA-binding CsgD family transcriptional regulator
MRPESPHPRIDPDRRAWYLAEATPGPDEEVAAELERSADRAQARGGLAATAAFLERSAALTLVPFQRAERALAAAEAKAQAGAFDAALRLLSSAEAGPLDEFGRARSERLLGQIAYALRPGSDEAPQLLVKAAKRFEPLDASVARETYLEALSTVFGARPTRPEAEAARGAPRQPGQERAIDLLLDAQVLLYTAGYPAAVGALRRALSAFRAEAAAGQESFRWLWSACHMALMLWDDENLDMLTGRQVQLARDAGALGLLPLALSQRCGIHFFAGDLKAAETLVADVSAAAEATGSGLPPHAALGLAAFNGSEAEVCELARGTIKEVIARSQDPGALWATAVLCNGLGRFDEGLTAALRASEAPDDHWSSAVLPELIEAAVRSGEAECAAATVRRLTELTQATGTRWAMGAQACAQALVSDGESAEHWYREAIEQLGGTRVRLLLARAHLLYGEWLRRENRRVDARVQLRTAHELFVAMGAEAFGDRAARELLAAGAAARKNSPTTSGDLTAQEIQVARLARDGLSNSEISARLFISPRTVEYHLHKVFAKLGINSRNKLNRSLSQADIAR